MANYDEIRARLESAVEEARIRQHKEVEDKERATAALLRAMELHNRFVLHGILPEDFEE